MSGRLPRGAGSNPAGTTSLDGVSMKVTIESLFYVRGKPVSSYYSFPVYSDEIEATMTRQLEFLQRHGSEFKLTLTVGN